MSPGMGWPSVQGMEGSPPTVDDYAVAIAQIRTAIGDNKEATAFFEEMLIEHRHLMDHHEEYRHCTDASCLQPVVEVKCANGHTSKR